MKQLHCDTCGASTFDPDAFIDVEDGDFCSSECFNAFLDKRHARRRRDMLALRTLASHRVSLTAQARRLVEDEQAASA